MGFLAGIWSAIAAGFAYFTKREENKPKQQQRKEVQLIRKERDENIQKIDDWADRQPKS